MDCYSLSDAARLLGVSREAVSAKAKRIGVGRSDGYRTYLTEAELLALAEPKRSGRKPKERDGYFTVHQAAYLLNATPSRLQYYVNRWRLGQIFDGVLMLTVAEVELIEERVGHRFKAK